MIGQPCCFVPLVADRFTKKFGWSETERIRPVLGIATNWPAIEALRAGGDEALTIGVKQDATAIAILEMGDLPTRVGLPQADAIPVPRRQQPAVWTEFRSQHRQGVAPLTTIAEHGRVERATFVARGNIPETDAPAGSEGQPPVIRREAQALFPVWSPGVLRRRHPTAGSIRPSSRSPAGNSCARIGR